MRTESPHASEHTNGASDGTQDPFAPIDTASTDEARGESGKTKAAGDDLILSPSAPLDSARSFIADHYTRGSVPTLHHHDGAFLSWDGYSAYRLREDAALRSELYHYLDRALRWRKSPETGDWQLEPFQPTRNRVNDVLDAVKAETNLEQTTVPCWLDGQGHRPPAREILALHNGLLHVPTGELMEPDPAFLTLNGLDFDYDPNVSAPRHWMRFLEQLWPDDPEAINCLQEAMGYLLLPDTSQQKAFFVVGPRRSGKGTIGRIITALLGQRNVCNPTLAQLGHQFGLAPLINRTLALITDARLSGRADTPAIAERILSISGEDQQTIDRKHKAAWTGYLPTRIMVLSNELPKIADVSGALASRFVVLRLTRSFLGYEDPDLTRDLQRELPAILNWALDGWVRLQERGHFVQPESSRQAVQELEDLASPVGAFVRQRCVVDPETWCGVDHLYEAWTSWCEDNGQQHTSTKQRFSRDLRTVVPHLKVKRPKPEGGGPRRRRFEGIRLKQPQELEDEDDDL